MGGSLRVDPARLREAASAQAQVGIYVSGMATGQLMASAGSGMSDLLTGGACQAASSMFDQAATTAHDELTTHSQNLSSAADQYDRTDTELGRRLAAFSHGG